MTILDVNDQPPVFHPLPESCVVVTEFHEPGETVYSLKASDADDPNTPNGWVNFSILGGDVQGIYFEYGYNLPIKIKWLNNIRFNVLML